jgi:hypothetical protein
MPCGIPFFVRNTSVKHLDKNNYMYTLGGYENPSYYFMSTIFLDILFKAHFLCRRAYADGQLRFTSGYYLLALHA